MARLRTMLIVEGLEKAALNSYTVTSPETLPKVALTQAKMIADYARRLTRVPQRSLKPGAPWWTRDSR